jgi:hypothetical protein
VQRRVVDLWRQCAEGVHSPVDWAARYRQLLADLARLSAEDAVPDAELRSPSSAPSAVSRAPVAPR